MSIDLKDVYVHIPIQSQSRKYLSFHIQGLPFGLSTTPMEFTIIAKARSHQTFLQHRQTLVAICQDLGWLVNMEEPDLEPNQVFNFEGCQCDLKEDTIRPTLDRR